MAYFDSTFFSVMKITEGNNSTTARKLALLLSYVLFVVNIVLPVFLIALIYRRFEILKIKEAKQSFNTMLTQIDKASRYRVANPAYFFFRRLFTAILLTLPVNHTFIFLQYVFILMSSHAYILYMVALKPYQTAGVNSYVLANETFYSALIIAIFIFSDATPELNIKFGAGVALMVSLVLLVLSNVITNVVYMIRGRANLKHAIKTQKLRRAEKEALMRAEEEERRLKKKKEEEEFTKLPDDTQNMSLVDNNTSMANTVVDLKKEKSSKKRKGKDKTKKADDNVVEDFGNGDDGGSDLPASKKRRRQKEKNNRDDVTEGTIGDAPGEKKRRRRRRDGEKKAKDFDDFENNVPTTQKDFL